MQATSPCDLSLNQDFHREIKLGLQPASTNELCRTTWAGQCTRPKPRQRPQNWWSTAKPIRTGGMKRNTSVIWAWLLTASIVGLVGVFILAAIHIWGRK